MQDMCDPYAENVYIEILMHGKHGQQKKES